MKKTPSSVSGFSRLRVLFACILCTIGAGLAMISFAADPAFGTITPASSPVTWNGTATGLPPAAGGEPDCEEGANCDTFKLTVSGTPADWIAAGKQVKVRIQWLLNSSDFDLAVHKGSIDGPLVGSSGGAATTSEEVVLNPASPSIGTGDFFIRAIYYAATQADQYNGVASVVGAASPPTVAPPASGVAPRYQNITAPAAGPATLGIDAGEPSIGVNWTSETGQNGGRAMYIALLQTLRITFNDACPSSPSSLWEDKSFQTTSAITFDPILFTDRTTGRTVVSQLLFPLGSLTTLSAFTTNDGDLWTESTGAGFGAGIDHQTIGGGGPFHAPLINPAYPNAIYYCAQLPASSCAISLDGGMSYGPAVPAYTDACGGLHGHIKVGPDGTAYLPNKDCGTEQALVVSEDNGATWQVRPVPGSTAADSDAAVGIGRGDATAGKGRVYLGYADGDTRAVISTSVDNGLSWSPPLDVGAALGINNVVFPAVVAGDDNRAAYAFYGTPTEGGLQGPRFGGIWHLYVAHTYDGGQTWFTVDVTPGDPIQRGCIWLGGGANICRNMLDFMGIDVDKRGRVLIGYNDGCAGAECSQALPEATGNSYTALAAIARQTGGKGLFAAHDALFPDAPTVPGAPYVTALRNGAVVRLAWSTSNNGGSPVTGYTISRGTTSGGETFLANVPGSQLRYDDATATNTGVTYFYKVTATNGQGASCGNNEVSARYVGDSFTGEGYILYTDPTGVSEGAPQAANPDLDIETLSIAEPTSGPNAGKLVFNLRVVDLSTVPNNRMWRIIWDSPNAPNGNFYVGKTKDANGVVSYEYGTVATAVVGLVLGLPTTTKVGDADSGSFTPDGLITIVLSKDKVASPQLGDLLGNFAVRTYNVVTNEIRSTNAIDAATNATANDFTANAATYALVGLEPIATPTPTPVPINITGTVSYCPNPHPRPVPNVTLTLTGSASGSTLSDGSGNYQFLSVASGGTYTVTPSKAARTPGSPGITTVDVIAVQQHYLLFAVLPAGCRRDAANVDGNTLIDTVDVIAIQRFFLGFSTGIGNTGKYQFTPASRTYSGVGSNQTGQNYTTLVFGDVAGDSVEGLEDGSTQDAGDNMMRAGEVAPTVATIALPEVAVDQAKSNFIAAVTTSAIDGNNMLAGFQGDLTFDERVVTFGTQPVQKAGMTGGSWNVSGNVLPGAGPIRTLRISAYSNDLMPLSGSGTLFELRMTRVSKAAQGTPLHWAAPPDNFIFIDSDLQTQKPGYAVPGSVSPSRK